MCNCEKMTNNVRDRNIAQFFRTVFSNYEDEAGKVSYDKLGEILRSLGRQLSRERIERIRSKFDPEQTGLVDLSDPEFIMAVAALSVVDVRAIDDSVLSSAFSIFDMVGTVLVHTNIKTPAILYYIVGHQFLIFPYKMAQTFQHKNQNFIKICFKKRDTD